MSHPFEPPQEESQLSGAPIQIGTRVFAGAIIVLACIAIGGVLVTRARFLNTMEEFELDLSLVSKLAVSPLLVALLAVLGVAIGVKEVLVPSIAVRRVLNLLGLLSVIVVILVYVIGTTLPVLNLFQSLQG